MNQETNRGHKFVTALNHDQLGNRYRFRQIAKSTLQSRGRQLPLQWQLAGKFALSGGILVALLWMLFVFHESEQRQSEFKTRLRTAAGIIGTHCIPEIKLNNKQKATAALQAFAHLPDVFAACLYDSQGRIFATWQPTERPVDFPTVVQTGSWQALGQCHLTVSLSERGTQRGAIYVLAESPSVYANSGVYLGMLLVSLGGLSLATLIIAGSFNNMAAAPIRRLALAIRAVSREGNYSLRLESDETGDIGELYEECNRLLSETETRCQGVSRVRRQLEKFVGQYCQEHIDAEQPCADGSSESKAKTYARLNR